MMSSYITATLARTSNSTACLRSALPCIWVIVMEHLIYDWNKGILSVLDSILSFSSIILADGSTSHVEGTPTKTTYPYRYLLSVMFLGFHSICYPLIDLHVI